MSRGPAKPPLSVVIRQPDAAEVRLAPPRRSSATGVGLTAWIVSTIFLEAVILPNPASV